MATIDILFNGYAGRRVASTVTLVRDGAARVIIDPGMVPAAASILDPLARLGVSPGEITDVVLSHHHPDHTMNVALFPGARVHDHWAIYHGDVWETRPAEGFQVSPSVRLWETPGHTAQDVTTLVEGDEGVVAFTHLWWTADGPAEDPLATEPGQLHYHRLRVLELAVRIVPGHGPPFTPDDDTPR